MEGISFTDISGPLPYTFVRGYRYIFFLYSNNANVILMEPMRSRDDRKMTQAYTKLHVRLEAVGIKPKINIMDNEASRAIKKGSRRKIQSTRLWPRVMEAIKIAELNVLSPNEKQSHRGYDCHYGS